ncbi:MAG: hypothetical protein H6811_03310 [Phycisphaeraceae bacterium]|nr:hypothetical protein [Phycisphaeraceae bacterium]
MIWNSIRLGTRLAKGALFRRQHSIWLTRAIRGGRRYPRIPLERVDRGGFDHLRAHPAGRHAADSWWVIALRAMEAEDADGR